MTPILIQKTPTGYAARAVVMVTIFATLMLLGASYQWAGLMSCLPIAIVARVNR